MKGSKGISTRLIAAAIGCVCIFGVAAGLSSNAVAAPTEKPTVQALPAISGTPEPDQTLTCTTGTWSQEPLEYGFEWLRDGTLIAGETETEYEVVEADRGHGISCAVTATNSFGSTTARSGAVAVPTKNPVVQESPEVKGTPEPGQTLTCTTGTWTKEPFEYGFEWLRDGTLIAGETETEYEVVEADRGHGISCAVTATNSFGSTKARSGTVAVPLVQHALTVAVSGNGSGLVSSEPGGIFCGVACQLSFAEGTVVVLTAAADPGSAFSGWSGACSGSGSCSVSLDSDQSVGASFVATHSDGGSTGSGSTGGGSVTTPTPKPKPKPLKCRKGFKKKKVKGKPKCVKVQKKHQHKKKR